MGGPPATSSVQSGPISGLFAARPLADSPITFYSGVQACNPEPVAYAIDYKDGEGPHVPYPGGMKPGALATAEHHIKPNRHLGWEIVPLYAGVGPATTSNEGSQDG